MQGEFKKILNFLFKDNKGKPYLQYGYIFIFVIISLFVLNYYFIAVNIEPKLFYPFSAARLVILKGLDPYSESFLSQVSTFSGEDWIGLLPKEHTFGLPIFTLFLFFPFTLIQNYYFAQTLWIVLNQILIVHILFTLIKLFDWNIEKKYYSQLAIISIFLFFLWVNVFEQNLSIIQSGFLIYSMYYEKRGKMIYSGIFLGLCLINPFYFMIPILIYLLILFRKKSSAVIQWMTITVLLLSLSSLIFQPNWIFAYIKSLLLNSSIFPFNPSAENYAFITNTTERNLFNIIPLGMLVWMIVEWFRTPFNKSHQQYWIISLAFILGQFITIQPDSVNSVLLFPVFIFIAYLWDIRTKSKLRIYTYLVGIFLSFGLLIINYLVSKDLYRFNYFQLMNIASSFFLIINLYWIRPWVIAPYSLESDLVE